MISERYYRKRIMEDYKINSYKLGRIQSSPLLSDRGLVVGMGSVFNIGGKYFDYSYSKSSENADFRAIKRDWEIVGKNLSESLLKEVY